MVDENLFDGIDETDNIQEELQKAAKDSGAKDSVFDYNTLPDAPTQKYNRVELHGKTVTIKSAVIEKPPIDEEWHKTLNSSSLYKPYGFIIFYNTENSDREYLSGLKGFKDDKTGELGKPSMFREGQNQVSQLFNKYKAYTLKKTGITDKEFDKEYGLKKFMAFLNSGPQAVIETVSISFQGKTHRKNLVREFI